MIGPPGRSGTRSDDVRPDGVRPDGVRPVGAGGPADLRLAGAAAGAWLAALVVLGLTPAAGFAAAVAAAAVAAACLAAAHRRTAARRWRMGPGGRLAVVLAGVAAGAAIGAAATAGRVAVRDSAAVRSMAGLAGVQLTGVVTGDPRTLRSTFGVSYLVPVRLGTVATARERLDVPGTRVLVMADDPAWLALLPGQSLSAAGRLAAARGGDLTAAVLRASGPPRPHGPPPWYQRAAGGLRAGLQRACAGLPADPGGLLPGLVLGDTSRLTPGVDEAFRAAGMTHLLAVSGSNVALILGLALMIARWCRASPRVAGAACALALTGFVILVRPSPSVLRAAGMGALAVLALVGGRPRAAVPGLSATVLVLIVVDPALARDAGFALSTFATAGLLLIAPAWRDALRRRRVPAGLAEAIAVAGAAQVACAPVIAAISGTVSLVAVPANLLAVPAVPPATVLGVAAAVVSPVWPAGAATIAWLGAWPARWLVAVAWCAAGLPAAALPWPAGAGGALALAVLSLAAWWLCRRAVLRRGAAVLLAAATAGVLGVRVAAPGWPPPGWLMVACDVGQGDLIVLNAAPGQAVVVDAGPQAAPADRCLRGLKVRAIPLLVLTHAHADHTGGLEGVLRGRAVGAVLLPPADAAAAEWSLVRAMAAARRLVPVSAGPGAIYRAGAVSLTVLGPITRLRGTRSDANNNSLVLRADFGAARLLLAGDAEREEQAAVYARSAPGDLRASVLKVAHHGSAYQDGNFLSAVDPALAVVSVGAENRYGQPDGAVLHRLCGGGIRVVRTDRDGAVAVASTPTGLDVVPARTAPRECAGDRARGP